jgi:hypothetical protein
MTPLEHDQGVGERYFFKFEIDDFGDAKAKTKQAISWLEERDFEIETSWGDAGLCLDSLSEEALRSLNGIDDYPGFDPVRVTRPFVSLVDEKTNKAPAWRSRLMRIAARADGSAEPLPIAFRSCEARILLDLALESYSDYTMVLDEWEDVIHGYHVSKLCRYHTKDLEKATTVLQEIIGKLHAALDEEQTRPEGEGYGND